MELSFFMLKSVRWIKIKYRVRACAGPFLVYSNSYLTWKKTKSKYWKTLTINNGRITPKPHAHLQTMINTSARFQKDRLKTIRGIVSTSYTSHCVAWRTESRTDGRTHFNRMFMLITAFVVRGTHSAVNKDICKWIGNALSRLQAELRPQNIYSFITKRRLYNFDPLNPNFYVVKLGFTGVYIICPILLKFIDCGTR